MIFFEFFFFFCLGFRKQMKKTPQSGTAWISIPNIHFLVLYKTLSLSECISMDFNRNRKKLITFTQRKKKSILFFLDSIFSLLLFRCLLLLNALVIWMGLPSKMIKPFSYNFFSHISLHFSSTLFWDFYLNINFFSRTMTQTHTHIRWNRLISLKQSIFLRCDGFLCWIVYMVRWSSSWLLLILTRKKKCVM